MSDSIIRVQGEILNELPSALYLPPKALRVQLQMFEGPLDLLLYLVRKHKFDVLDIPMTALCKQYIAYMEEILHSDMETVADYLSMSALLIEIKTKMLLPRIVIEDEDENDPRADLVRQLLEYERIKTVSASFDQLSRRSRDFTSPLVSVEIPLTVQKPVINASQISNAFASLMARLKANENYKVIPETISIRAVMSEIIRFFAKKRSFSFFEVVKPKQGGITFMALLQMQLEKMVVLKQEQDDDELIIEQTTEKNI